MTVQIDIYQDRTLVEPNIYRILTRVMYAKDINSNIIVFNRITEEFSHGAYPYDIETYPVGLAQSEIDGTDFYRLSEVVSDFNASRVAAAYAEYTRTRVDVLVANYQHTVNEFIGAGEYSYRGDE